MFHMASTFHMHFTHLSHTFHMFASGSVECSGIYNTNNIIFLGEAYKPRQMLYIFSGSSGLKS